jgi:hypothetical protein
MKKARIATGLQSGTGSERFRSIARERKCYKAFNEGVILITERWNSLYFQPFS